ncbi:MAG: thioredoxin TrxC [Dechloromonas sp.]|nr:MAG: thioredoxin TrxC [Dechloromonas sp.]
MSENLHVVCPHCAAVNRLPGARLGQQPNCGQCKQPLFTGEPVELNAGTFDRHIGRSDLPVVVDFWAPWCGPCRTMAPNFHQAAIDLEPHVRLAKVNTEEEQQLAARFNIRSIPTLAIFSGGREIARHSGAVDLGTLKRWIGGHLQKP